MEEYIVQVSHNLSGLYNSHNVREDNTKILDSILKLEKDWNDNNADPFSKILINKCKLIIEDLTVQPDIFPTANDSIQMEYEKDNGSYLEFEIFDNRIEVFCIDSFGNEREFLADGVEQMNLEIKKFIE